MVPVTCAAAGTTVARRTARARKLAKLRLKPPRTAVHQTCVVRDALGRGRCLMRTVRPFTSVAPTLLSILGNGAFDIHVDSSQRDRSFAPMGYVTRSDTESIIYAA